VLIDIAQRLRSVVREDDVVVHFGGDEFVLVFWGVADKAFADQACQKIKATLEAQWLCLQGVEDAQVMTVAAAIGVTFYPPDGKDAETPIKLVDHGMYEDKISGRTPRDALRDEGSATRTPDQARHAGAIG